MALGADERRDKLRKAAGSGTYTVIRRCLNGGTHVSIPYVPHAEGGNLIGMWGEPGELKHLSSRRKREQKFIPRVAASEMGGAQTSIFICWGMDCRNGCGMQGNGMGRPAREGEGPVPETGSMQAGSGVLRGTWNLVGRSGDHPARLNTTQ